MNWNFNCLSCCAEEPPADIPFPRTLPPPTKISVRRKIFEARCPDYLLLVNDDELGQLSQEELELRGLMQYQRHLKTQIKGLDRFYEQEILPLEQECIVYRDKNTERVREINNINTRLRAVQNGFIRTN